MCSRRVVWLGAWSGVIAERGREAAGALCVDGVVGWCAVSGVHRWSVSRLRRESWWVGAGYRQQSLVERGPWRGDVCGSVGLWRLEGAACMGRLVRV